MSGILRVWQLGVSGMSFSFPRKLGFEATVAKLVWLVGEQTLMLSVDLCSYL